MNQVSPATLLKAQEEQLEDTEVVEEVVEEVSSVAGPITEETKTAPVQVETPVAPVKDTPSVAALYMTEYINRYLTINNGYLETEVQRQKAIEAFRQIMRHALKNPEYAVLNQVSTMFSDPNTRTRVLSESVALQGIDRQSKETQMQMSIFYRIFFDCTEPGKRPKFNMDEIRNILKNDKLINYLIAKFNL